MDRVTPSCLIITTVSLVVFYCLLFGIDPRRFLRRSKELTLKDLKSENALRLREARVWLEDFQEKSRSESSIHPHNLKGLRKPLPQTPTSLNHRPSIEIVVVTTPRRGDFFTLTQTAATMGRLSRLQHNFDVVVVVCDVASGVHEEADSLADAFTIWKKPGQPKDFELNIFEKEKRDYVFCLNSTRHSDFVLMLEDDAVAHDDFFPVLANVLSRTKRYPEISSALYLKLHHPESLLGWLNPEPARLLEWVILSFVGTTATLWTMEKLVRNGKRTTSGRLRNWTRLFLAFLVLLELVGRKNLIRVKRLHPSLYGVFPAPDCCTQANLFPRKTVELVVETLDVEECNRTYAKDAALDALKRRHPVGAFSVEPNLVKHIGLYSTLRKSPTVNPLSL